MHYPPYVQGSDRVVMRFMPTKTWISSFGVGENVGIGRFFPTFSATLPISGDAFNAEVDGINKAIETAGAPPTSPAVYLTGLVGLIGAVLMMIGIISFSSPSASADQGYAEMPIGMILLFCGCAGTMCVSARQAQLLEGHIQSVMSNIVTPACAELTRKYSSVGVSWAVEATSEQVMTTSRNSDGYRRTHMHTIAVYSLVVSSTTPAVQATAAQAEAEFAPTFAVPVDAESSNQLLSAKSPGGLV